MPKDDEYADIAKCRVVLVDIADEKSRYRVIKALTGELGVDFEEAERLIKTLPQVIMSSLPDEAAEVLADKIRDAGATVEVQEIVPMGGRYCEWHPDRQIRAKCKHCEKYICDVCILDARKQFICPDCLFEIRRKRFYRRFVAVFTILFVGFVWFNIREDVHRYLRYINKNKHVNVAVIGVALNPDQEVSAAFTALTAAALGRALPTEPGRLGPGAKTIQAPRTAYDIEQWFQSEWDRIGFYQEDILNITYYGIYTLPAEPPLPRAKEAGLFSWLSNRGRFSAFFRKQQMHR